MYQGYARVSEYNDADWRLNSPHLFLITPSAHLRKGIEIRKELGSTLRHFDDRARTGVSTWYERKLIKLTLTASHVVRNISYL